MRSLITIRNPYTHPLFGDRLFKPYCPTYQVCEVAKDKVTVQAVGVAGAPRATWSRWWWSIRVKSRTIVKRGEDNPYRDPRIDPQAGDLLRTSDQTLIEVLHVQLATLTSDAIVVFSSRRPSCDSIGNDLDLRQFQRLVRDADHVAWETP